MTAHDPRVTLTEADVSVLNDLFERNHFTLLIGEVERIIAARLASELRQAGQDFLAHEAARGPARPAFVRRWLHARADALDAPVSAPQDHDGAEGQGEGEWSRRVWTSDRSYYYADEETR